MDDDALAERLRQTVGELVRAVRVVDTMPPGEAAVLGFLDRGGPLTTADLAHRRGVTHQSAAKSVKELVGAGLVRAEPHPADGRKLLLHITDAGRARLRRERAQRAGALDAAIRDTFSPEERQRLGDCVGLLSRLIARLTGR
ncbi:MULTISPECIES: MarR family winged helix-turn-helix transcriptional regulator [Streptomycetaceae]|uniref:MarR family transcriptional regulator n=1 Tax=Streptantibioticus cattleyicolor (strain ATCC 35852 / DSM 46488 / JCM 4925 / NBRC 14057 / NRRL 8057) TaxID=1003195 RepID=F8JTX6_STREN|nr:MULTISPECIES: MarR family transcriptional regulator [Streptomycetaceae]AEW98066.1 MarR family transcriptional regulator [Streptantibioticus cattleyicolor NRRL 8057 = DSM 46488]MYS62460.1 MarR family transcriptional regulator [Streptomyces sp. SID5468]CCB78382.1 putative MarR-family transcriptional regulator [Streptantibioticus cattleyicolor NRRL 8057 = DSM 46488]